MSFFQSPSDNDMRIRTLKAAAAKYRIRFNAMLEEVDCGASMLKAINADASEAARLFNTAMAELKKIDPNCPNYDEL